MEQRPKLDAASDGQSVSLFDNKWCMFFDASAGDFADELI